MFTTDPGGLATFEADVTQGVIITTVRHQFATFAVTADGRLVDTSTNRTVGTIQASGNTLVLTYTFQQGGYQNTFQVPLQRL